MMTKYSDAKNKLRFSNVEDLNTPFAALKMYRVTCTKNENVKTTWNFINMYRVTCTMNETVKTTWTFINMYRVTCTMNENVKTTWNFINMMISRLNSALNAGITWLYYWFAKEWNNFTVARNHKYKETDFTNSVQSSLNSHPFR